MSTWTTINATIKINFGNQSRYWIEDFFGNIKDEQYSLFYDPSKKGDGCEITGSEMNAVVTYSPLREFENDPRNRYSRGNVWVVNVCGRLRDRTIDDTIAEWRRFAWKLGMFVKRSSKLDGDPYGTGEMRFAGLEFWTVDISGMSRAKDGSWSSVLYHRTSIKEKGVEHV